MKRMIDPIEQEIDKIRLGIYEDIKDMTPAEINEYYRMKTDATIKKIWIRNDIRRERNGVILPPSSLVQIF